MKEVETDMREAAVRYFEGCLSAQDEERLYRFIQESGGNYSLFKEWERQWLYLQPIITQYFIDNKSEIWLLFLIAHSKR